MSIVVRESYDVAFVCFQLNKELLFIDNLTFSLNINEYISIDFTIKDEILHILLTPANSPFVKLVTSLSNNPIVFIVSSGIYIPALDFSFYFPTPYIHDNTPFTFVYSASFHPFLVAVFNSDIQSNYIIKAHTQLLNSDIPALASLIKQNGVFILAEFDKIKSSDLLELSSANRRKQTKSQRPSSLTETAQSDFDPVDEEDDQDSNISSLLSFQDFLSSNPSLINSVQPVPSSAIHPRLQISKYCFSLLFKDFSYLITRFPSILFLLPSYLYALSRYLHGRNRFPLLSFFLPLLSSIISILVLFFTVSSVTALYGVVCYLIVGRILKIAYISSKLSRRFSCDIYPILLLVHIFPLCMPILLLNPFPPVYLCVITLLIIIFAQYYRFGLYSSHFIGDVRMLYKLSPPLLFSFLSFITPLNPVFCLILSFLLILILIISFPSLFHLA